MIRIAALVFAVCVSDGALGSAQSSRQPLEVWNEPTTGMTFVRLPPGRFVMGSPRDEPGREIEERQHDVTITRGFWIGSFEVTQRQWQAVMGHNPSWFAASGDDFPVERVNWYDVHQFLDRLSARAPGNRFRLPTEAEWEYACRAGTTAAYSTGPTLSAHDANVTDPATDPDLARGRTSKAGSFPPNPWGLYDMHGNVWEWTDDDHCPYADGPAVDPRGACGGRLKVIRGGSWHFDAASARCALRYTHRPQDRGFSLGFRVVRETLAGAREARQ